MDKHKLLQKLENHIIKKIKVEDIFLMAFGGRHDRDAKLIIKSMKKTEGKHLTLKFTKNGFIDIHETVGGTKKKYRPLAKIRIKDFSHTLMERLSILLSKSEIDNSSSKFKDYVVLIPRDRHARDELLSKSALVRKKKAIIDRRKLKSAFEELYIISAVQDVQNHDFDWAFVYVHGEPASSGILVKSGERFFLISSDELEGCLEDLFQTSFDFAMRQ